MYNYVEQIVIAMVSRELFCLNIAKYCLYLGRYKTNKTLITTTNNDINAVSFTVKRMK